MPLPSHVMTAIVQLPVRHRAPRPRAAPADHTFDGRGPATPATPGAAPSAWSRTAAAILAFAALLPVVACGDRRRPAAEGQESPGAHRAEHAGAMGATGAGPIAKPPEPTPPFQGIYGVARQERPDAPIGTLRDARTAVHPGYDRVVFEFDGERLPGYEIEYVDRPIRACGSGDVVPLAGTGRLRVRFRPARAHTDEGAPTLPRRDLTPDLPVLKELKVSCDFEGRLEWGLGLATPNAYRVLELGGPPRLVVDVGH